MNLRRRKTQPHTPEPTPRPDQAAAEILTARVAYTVTQLQVAIRNYATEPDSIPAGLRVDYAATIALDEMAKALANLQAEVAIRPDDDRGWMAEFQYQTYRSLIVGTGLPAMFAEVLHVAELRQEDQGLAMEQAVAQAHRWVDDAAALAMVGE